MSINPNLYKILLSFLFHHQHHHLLISFSLMLSFFPLDNSINFFFVLNSFSALRCRTDRSITSKILEMKFFEWLVPNKADVHRSHSSMISNFCRKALIICYFIFFYHHFFEINLIFLPLSLLWEGWENKKNKSNEKFLRDIIKRILWCRKF